MTTTISSKGQVVIPRPIRERHKFRARDDFLLFELANGDIMLRRVRSPNAIARVAFSPSARPEPGAPSRAGPGGCLVNWLLDTNTLS